MEKRIIKITRGPMPIHNEYGTLTFSKEDFCGADIYRAIAGRAKARADIYCDFIIAHCDIEQPDYSSSGNLEMFVAWAAFSCEVYLKSLIYHINADELFNEAPDGSKRFIEHSLLDLFNILEAINNNGSEYAIRITEGLSDFSGRLNSVSNYFIKYRYDYELKDEEIDYSFVFDLLKKLQSITNEIEFIKSMEIVERPDRSILIS